MLKKIVAHRYFIALGFLALLLGSKALYIANETFTGNISISQNTKKLSCQNNIHTLTPESIEDFIQDGTSKHRATLQEIICTIDQTPIKTDQDRVQLFIFTQKQIAVWIVNRHDIAQHFYRKIIEANPDDALSLYLRSKMDSQRLHPK